MVGGAIGTLLGVLTKSHTTAVAHIGGYGTTRVDWEEPTDDTPGNVHVQGKGRGGIPKIKIESLDDLAKLPKAIRENEKIRRELSALWSSCESFEKRTSEAIHDRFRTTASATYTLLLHGCG